MGIEKVPVDVSTEPEPTDKLQTSLDEKANESAEMAMKDDAASTDTAERVKGHPIIRNGKHDQPSYQCTTATNTSSQARTCLNT